jgi:DNA polymerase-1
LDPQTDDTLELPFADEAASAVASVSKDAGPDSLPPPPRLLLIDGHALVYRAYHALPPDLRTSKGEPTNAVLGFTQMLMDTLRKEAPQYIVVTFDKGRTFRHDASADYKATRTAMPDDLRGQMSRVREIVQAMGIPIFELQGFEADDLIGTLSKQAEEMGIDTYILSGDNDQHQLVSEHVRMIAPGGYRQRFSDAKVYDLDAVHERYGFGPELVPDFKALVGDKSDNIPNVPGIGDKGASSLLQQYGSLEGIIEHIDELKPKVAESLREHMDQARASKVLATIVRDAPVTLDLEASRATGFDHYRVIDLLRELEFRKLLDTLAQVEIVLGVAGAYPTAAAPGETQGKPSPGGTQQMNMFGDGEASTATAEETSDPRRSTVEALQSKEERERAGIPERVNIVRTATELKALVDLLRESERFTVDVESTSANELDADLVGISIAPPTPDGNVLAAFYIPVGHVEAQEEGPPKPSKGQLPLDTVRKALAAVLANPNIKKDAHNAKYDAMVLKRAGLPVEGLGFDTMIAAYLAGETSTGLKDLAFTKLGIQMVPIEELIGKRGRNQITMDLVPIDLAAPYAAADVAVTESLRHLFTRPLEEAGLWELFNEIEMPLVSVLADMELTGVALNVPWLQKLSTILHEKMGKLQEQIYEEAKHPFNINSSQQLGSVLFEELGLPGRKRTQTGYSTDRDVLDSLKGLHPIIDDIIEYRHLVKLKNTYIDALPLLVRTDTGRVHTSFNQSVAATGRLSSSQPNLQNIPIRTEIGRDVRKAFIADNDSPHKLFGEESLLLAADYSQIELRLLAHMAKEERLIAAFEAGEDIHTATAAEILGVPLEQVDPDSRRLAKTINFGVLYGMGSYGLARDSGLSQQEAAKFIELYWSRYPAVRLFMDRTLQEGRQVGYVSTLLGRRRYMPELQSRNAGLRQQAERMAINAPVQGTAADIIKIAMNRLHAEMKRRGLKSKMLLQVHDELLFEVPRSELQEMADVVCETMEGALELDVPLRVDIKAGTNWGEMQPLQAD